LLEFWE